MEHHQWNSGNSVEGNSSTRAGAEVCVCGGGSGSGAPSRGCLEARRWGKSASKSARMGASPPLLVCLAAYLERACRHGHKAEECNTHHTCFAFHFLDTRDIRAWTKSG